MFSVLGRSEYPADGKGVHFWFASDFLSNFLDPEQGFRISKHMPGIRRKLIRIHNRLLKKFQSVYLVLSFDPQVADIGKGGGAESWILSFGHVVSIIIINYIYTPPALADFCVILGRQQLRKILWL